MEILSLSTESFRNLAPGRLEFHPRLNLIVGANGQGKTNLLEAITLLCGRSSFRTSDLSTVRAHGTPRATVTACVKTGEREEALYGLVLSEETTSAPGLNARLTAFVRSPDRRAIRRTAPRSSSRPTSAFLSFSLLMTFS